MNIGFISLGCSKNLVDTEMMIGIFKRNEFNIVSDPKDADIILINTCGFIESAKQEAIDTILEMIEYKKSRCQYIVATGCLVKRYKKELEKEIPEVDLFISCNDYDEFWKLILQMLKEKGILKKNDYNDLNYKKRVITTGNKMAYLKIAEGCSNHCTYCAIPYIRGPFISRKLEEIVEEAEKLSQEGIEEIVLIAQDTTKYGIDLYKNLSLPKLLKELCKIDKIKWIRFLYSYPETITDELIQIVKENDKICKYFDIPIQHISDNVLKRMNRKSDKNSIEKLIKKLKQEIPEVILRTTVIVGFPGETKEEFEELYNFIEQTHFDKLGAFKYSKEEGTPAAKLPNQVHVATKKSRYNKIMTLQQKISRQQLEKKIGKTYDVLIEGRTLNDKKYIGRTYMDVADIDGVVLLESSLKKESLIGKFVKCQITGVEGYDLIGKVL
ncbi:MAG: 30S ribosomal protein S12 methylthiotransferase RimO [Clostridia bacterium]|nr:30S ribosomal protein S12 methylthiotransferase RimO [Clostridia bacterium]